MNPGPVEEAGKATHDFMHIFRQQPLALALVLMNLALLGLVYIILTTVAEQRQANFTMFYEQSKLMREQMYQDHKEFIATLTAAWQNCMPKKSTTESN